MVRNRRYSISNLGILIFQFGLVFVVALIISGYFNLHLTDIMETIKTSREEVFSLKLEALENPGEHEEALQALNIRLTDLEENYSTYQRYNLLVQLVLPVVLIVYLLVLSVIVRNRVKKNTDDLQEAAEAAEKANEAKTMFLANMSHEIRTPLNAIIGFSAILKESLADAKEKDFASLIHSSAEMLLSIINDILDLSKIESGKIDLEFRPFDVDSLLRQIVDMYTVRASDKGVRLIYVADRHVPPRIIGDSLRLQQVITNLLANAVKFTPKGGSITLSVTVLEDAEDRSFLEFSVKDTGIGITKEAQEKIFKPFSQADGGVTRNFGGTGLGLTISQKILHAMHSRLELESFLRQGSTFSFKVFFDKDMRTVVAAKGMDEAPLIGVYPADKAKTGPILNLIKRMSAFGEVQSLKYLYGDEEFKIMCLVNSDELREDYQTIRLYYPGIPIVYIGNVHQLRIDDRTMFEGMLAVDTPEEGIREVVEDLLAADSCAGDEVPAFEGKVLVAEDNITNRLLIQILLEKVGLDIDFARDGYEAVEAVRHQTYDLIFMDIHMPNKDGVTACKEILLIEKDEQRLHTPTVALTANALKGDREKYLAEGMDEYIAKPISEGEVLKVLDKFLTHVPERLKRRDDRHQKRAVLKGESTSQKLMPLQVDYDPGKAAEEIGLDRITLDMLLENFFFGFDEDLGVLRTALIEQKPEEVKKAAHYLKGAALNLKIQGGADLFRQIELLADEGELESVELGVVAGYFKQLREGLNF